MIQDKIVCPKCKTRSLRKAYGRNPIAEMFCDKDHEYFSIWELVNIWGYDAGDFVNQNNVSLLPSKKTPQDYIPDWLGNIREPRFDTLSMFEGEPIWKSNQEREEAYEMVQRMFQGISELEKLLPCGHSNDNLGNFGGCNPMGSCIICDAKDYQDWKYTQECALDIGVQ